MNQYNLISHDTNRIYYGTNPKLVATKVFRNLTKSNIDQTRICLEDNNTKKKYYYLGMTSNKLNEYQKEINKKNPNQIGGSAEQVDDKELFRKLSDLSGSINLSVDELVKILKTKYDPDSDGPEGKPNVITLVTEGINKLDTLNNSVQNINNEVIAMRDEIAPRPPVEVIPGTGIGFGTGTETDKNGGFCTIM